VTTLVEANPAAAKDLAFRAPDAKILDTWQDAVNDPDVDLIDICLPDNLHYEVAKAALLAGKHVYCEKPLADTAPQARELADIAQEKGLITRVGHSFPRNPIHDRAKEIIEAGEIGEIKLFKACQHIDIYGDPLAPYMWRADGSLAPTGIIGDTGSHVFSFMEFLVGKVSSLIADSYITAPKRPKIDGLGYGDAAPDITENTVWGDVTNPDGTNILCTFENGAKGLIDFSRVATGRKFMQTYEIYGTKGAIRFDQEDQNAIWLYNSEVPEATRGFTKILTGPEHPDYLPFCQGPGHGTGYQDQIIIEAKDFLEAIHTGKDIWPTFEDGLSVIKVTEAALQSAESGQWQSVEE